MNDKIEFDLSIEFDNNYEVIANGKLINKQINKLTTTWHYDMQQPMSSYLVALAIGNYKKKVETSKSGIRFRNVLLSRRFVKIRTHLSLHQAYVRFFRRRNWCTVSMAKL